MSKKKVYFWYQNKKGFLKKLFLKKKGKFFFSFPVVAPPWRPPHRHRKTHRFLEKDEHRPVFLIFFWEKWERERKGKRRKRESEEGKNEKFLGFLGFYTMTGSVWLDQLNRPDRSGLQEMGSGPRIQPFCFFFLQDLLLLQPPSLQTPPVFFFLWN
jgi:hypothetical protein